MIDTKQIAPSGATLQQPLVFDPATQHWVPIGSAPLRVANLAGRPAVATVPNAQLVFVESQRSWYRSDTLSGTYLREPIADVSWRAQTAWGIDTATGSDENVGTIASPLRTMEEFLTRLPAISRDTTATIAAGSAFAATDWIGGLIRTVPGAQAAQPTLTFQGVRTLGPNLVVATSTNEVGNAAPTIDTGAPLTVGRLIQATSGASANATAVVVALIAGTNYRTTPWVVGGFTRTVPPAPGDTIAIVTAMPTVPWVCLSNPTGTIIYADLDIATTFQESVSSIQIFRTCRIGGLFIGFQTLAYSLQGCALNLTAFQFQLSKTQINGCGIVLTGAPNVLIEGGASVYLTDTVIEGAGTIALRNNAVVEMTSLGIFDTTGTALLVLQGAMARVRGTLYGAGNAVGTIVRSNGHISVETGTPTLTSVGTELTLEASAQALPPSSLAPGAAVPANWPAPALGTWVAWNGAPFNRYVMSYASGASISGP